MPHLRCFRAALSCGGIDEAFEHGEIGSGFWFAADIWEGGRTPVANAFVTIPGGVEITYDGVSSVPLAMVRVGGGLTFATDQDTCPPSTASW